MVASHPYFRNSICWTARQRTEVMDPIALNVPDAVFAATHFPSFLQREGARRGAFVPLKEEDYLDDFLNADHLHVFDVAVGDSGAGKSHLIRWMHEETRRRAAELGNPKVVLIPRSSSNLADVIRRIIHGFDGEVARRLTEDLDRQQVLSAVEAKNRVLDELCHVLEDPGRSVLSGAAAIDGIEANILEGLPAMLRSPRLRQAMVGRADGVVSRVAEHVMGKRQAAPSAGELHWIPRDVRFSPRECEAADRDARETALLLEEDDACCQVAVDLVNRAQPGALRKLLRFRSGDMKAVLSEIRIELLRQRRELFLFIEDLSITEGVDAELIEALQIRTRDTGLDLCRLRSIVGVTTDDYARMRENIAEGRVRRTVFFNMQLGGAGSGGAVTQNHVAEFAVKYLNAARLSRETLNEWWADSAQDEVPNACDDCRARAECHEAFGEVAGRGLYPFTRTTVRRLYKQVAEARGQADKAFNPRLLVGRVLSELLEQAETALPAGEFPNRALAESFALTGLQVELQVTFRRQFPGDAERLARAIDLYAEDPSSSTPSVEPRILTALGLPSFGTSTGGKSGEDPPPPPPPDLKPSVTDEFTRWANEGRLSDSDLSRWRVAIHNAISAWTDWDLNGLACVRTLFKPPSIQIDGQATRQRLGFRLEIKRDPATAMALRALVSGFAGVKDYDTVVLVVRHQVASWSEAVVEELRKLREPEGSPYALAARVLVVGALMRGKVASVASDVDLLEASFSTWDGDEGEVQRGRSSPWTALAGAYRRRGAEVRKLLLDRYSCTKGAQTGAMLDPSAMLPDLRAALATGELGEIPASAEAWPNHRSVVQLSTDVVAQLATAIDSERAECSAQLQRINEHLAGNSIKDVLQAAKRGLQAAAEAGCLRYARVSNLEARLASMLSKPITASLQDGERAVTASTRPAQLAALGRTDRALLGDCLALLDDLKTVIAASRETMTTGPGGIGEEPENAKRAIRDLVARLRTGLDALGGK